MTENNRRTAISQEIRHGQDALRAARSLRSMGLRNDALNRLYYALYHHVVALLLLEGVEPRRHAAIPGLLGQHVVGRHELDGADVAAISRAGAFRGLADYERTWDADDRVVASAFDELEPLIERIRGYLVRTGWLEG